MSRFLFDKNPHVLPPIVCSRISCFLSVWLVKEIVATIFHLKLFAWYETTVEGMMLFDHHFIGIRLSSIKCICCFWFFFCFAPYNITRPPSQCGIAHASQSGELIFSFIITSWYIIVILNSLMRRQRFGGIQLQMEKTNNRIDAPFQLSNDLLSICLKVTCSSLSQFDSMQFLRCFFWCIPCLALFIFFIYKDK